MSQPKRFSLVGHEWIGDILEEKPDGEYVRHSDYAALAAENERLRSSQLSLEKWIACEQVNFETADNLREKLYQASVQIERLRQAGDVLMQCYCAGDLVKEEWKQLPSVAQWLAAKEGSDAK